VADRYIVHWSEQAERDVREIVEHMSREAPMAAFDLAAALERRAATLVSLPTRGRVVPELARFQIRTYRELIEGPYRILYRIDGRSLHVVTVVDSRRDLATLLMNRLLGVDRAGG